MRILTKKNILPNLRTHLHDLAHGARRLTSRPWNADEFLKYVYTTVMDWLGVIENSKELKKWFHACVYLVIYPIF